MKRSEVTSAKKLISRKKNKDKHLPNVANFPASLSHSAKKLHLKGLDCRVTEITSPQCMWWNGNLSPSPLANASERDQMSLINNHKQEIRKPSSVDVNLRSHSICLCSCTRLNLFNLNVSLAFPPFHSFFQIIRERLPDYPHRNGLVWNQSPGALLTIPTFSDTPRRLPFLLDPMGYRPGQNYTAVIFVQIGSQLTPNTALYKLVKSITKSQFIDKVNHSLPRKINSSFVTHSVVVVVVDSHSVVLRSAGTGAEAVAGDGAHSTARDSRRVQRGPAKHIPKIFPPRAHRDGRGALAGRGCHPQHRRAGLCLPSVAGLSGPHCRLSGAGPLLG